jgi:hypothetical protein
MLLGLAKLAPQEEPKTRTFFLAYRARLHRATGSIHLTFPTQSFRRQDSKASSASNHFGSAVYGVLGLLLPGLIPTILSILTQRAYPVQARNCKRQEIETSYPNLNSQHAPEVVFPRAQRLHM